MGVHTFPVKYSIPEEEDITWAVCRIFLNSSGGALGMWEEHLHQWLNEATQEKILTLPTGIRFGSCHSVGSILQWDAG